MSNMNNAPNTTPIEYTRGTGFSFPNQPSFAQNTDTSTTSDSTTAAATVGPTFPTNPSVGQLAYNQTQGFLYVWTGSTWTRA